MNEDNELMKQFSLEFEQLEEIFEKRSLKYKDVWKDKSLSVLLSEMNGETVNLFKLINSMERFATFKEEVEKYYDTLQRL